MKGVKGTPLSQCVKALTKLSKKTAKTPKAACKALTRKKVTGMKKSPYAVCVSGGKQLVADRRRSSGKAGR